MTTISKQKRLLSHLICGSLIVMNCLSCYLDSSLLKKQEYCELPAVKLKFTEEIVVKNAITKYLQDKIYLIDPEVENVNEKKIMFQVFISFYGSYKRIALYATSQYAIDVDSRVYFTGVAKVKGRNVLVYGDDNQIEQCVIHEKSKYKVPCYKYDPDADYIDEEVFSSYLIDKYGNIFLEEKWDRRGG